LQQLAIQLQFIKKAPTHVGAFSYY